MTREDAIFTMQYFKYHFAKREAVEAFDMAIEALKQYPKYYPDNTINCWIGKEVLYKIENDIQSLRDCSCSSSDGIIDDVEDVIEKYIEESEDFNYGKEET